MEHSNSSSSSVSKDGGAVAIFAKIVLEDETCGGFTFDKFAYNIHDSEYLNIFVLKLTFTCRVDGFHEALTWRNLQFSQ